MTDTGNPLLQDWDTAFGIPPFDKIEPGHFGPAIEHLTGEARDTINKIAENPDPPSFENTIVALEESTLKLNIVAATLFNLNSADTSPLLQEVTAQISPLLARFSNDITLNTKLFKRVKQVYDTPGSKSRVSEDRMLAIEKYRYFRNGGAGLDESDKSRFREISEELSRLSVIFEQNLLAETNEFFLHLTNKTDIDGLPAGVSEAASEEAHKRSLEGWVFTLHQPSYMPFMKYCSNRDLRKKMFMAYSSRCSGDNKYNNEQNVLRIVNLRLELANMLGYPSYADYVLEDRMAGSKENVNTFLESIFAKARPAAEKDLATLSSYANSKGHNGDIEKWDWPYYSEMLKKEKYSIDDEVLRPYFRLENVEKAVFKLAAKLYDISFEQLSGIPSYHKHTRTFNVSDADGTHLAILMVDYHPRKGKSSGAWMTAYREQHRRNGNDTRPLISIVMNFKEATKTTPSLLSHNELTTFLHEFGHALHGIFSRCKYESLSGTNVKRDFVELPSQIMENWAYEEEWLDSWAVHYKTGQSIPRNIIRKIRSELIFNEGYACNRQLSFGMLDMAWHSIQKPVSEKVDTFEEKAVERTELFKPLKGTNQSCAFGHLFSGGYAAGYYGYKWAEVLDADAYSMFAGDGIFNKDIALSFRKNILEKGASEEAAILYMNFRGREPSPEALFQRSGFITDKSE